MQCSLGVSNFLEEISNLSHSIVFPSFFSFFFFLHCSLRKAFLSISLLFFGTLHSDGCIFPFLLCLLLLFFPQLFVRPPQTTVLLFYFFVLGMVLITASCTMLRTSIHSSSSTLSIRSNPLNLFVTSTV